MGLAIQSTLNKGVTQTTLQFKSCSTASLYASTDVCITQYL
jgi:hypothetical protein